MNNMFADDAELCAADLRCFLMRVIVTVLRNPIFTFAYGLLKIFYTSISVVPILTIIYLKKFDIFKKKLF